MTFHLPKPGLAKFKVQYARGAYHVLSPEGDVVSGPFTDHNKAQMACDSRQKAVDSKSKKGPRSCLCCGETFASEGVHNRLCTGCRGYAHDTQAYSFINPRRRTG